MLKLKKRMLKLGFLLVVMFGWANSTLAESQIQPRVLIHQTQKGGAEHNPHIFLSIPKGRVRGFEVIEENNEEKSFNEYVNKQEEEEEEEEVQDTDENTNENNDGDGDESRPAHNNKNVSDSDNAEQDELKDFKAEMHDSDTGTNINVQIKNLANQIKNAKITKIRATSPHTGHILVPHEIIKIVGQTIIDENTGKSVFLFPRSVLDNIPNGSLLAIMRSPQTDQTEGRATRVIVRRRRKDTHQNLQHFVVNNQRYRVIKRKGNKRRNNFRHRNMIIVRRRNRQNGNKSGIKRRRIYLQG